MFQNCAESIKTGLKAPFPYFGGKSSVAAAVWRALGQPKHYIEPFCGSCSVLLLRPDYDPTIHVETVNDADGHIANVWRALKFDPEAVAEWADWPVNHADLSARKASIIKNEGRLLEGLISDPEWFDPKMAGYYIWAASCWIGSGLTRIGSIPDISAGGKGIHSLGKRPHVCHRGKGIYSIGQMPHLADGGIGVNAIGQRPHLSNGGNGVHALGQRDQEESTEGILPKNQNIYDWFSRLSRRLRHVRVVCGDWTRVCGGDWQDKIGDVGIFFDPPYGHKAGRDNDLYGVESTTVAYDVQEWTRERGKRDTYRIVLAGYMEEHDPLLSAGWRVMQWKTQGGYGNQAEGNGKANSHKEALFFSPHCLDEKREPDLFDFLDMGEEQDRMEEEAQNGSGI